MTPHHLTLAGLHAFPDEVSIDFDALPTLIGVQGANGSGKTTILEALTAATHLVMPSRPSALHRQFATPGYLQLVWSHGGHRYRSMVRCDPENDRTEATLSDAAKGDLLAGPLVRDYRRAVEAILGPLESVLATTVTIQSGAGAFLRCSRSERKALLAGWLGLGRFADYQDQAKTEATILEGKRTHQQAQIRIHGQRAEELPQLVVEGNRAEEALSLAQVRAGEAERGIFLHQQTAEVYRRELRDIGRAREDAAELTKVREALRKQINELRQRRVNNEGIVARGEEIRAAAARDAAIGVELALIGEESTAAYHAARLAQAEAGITDMLKHDREVYQRASDLLTVVPCHGEGIYAGCPLLKDARAAAERLPAIIEELAGRPAPVIFEVDPLATLSARTKTLQVERRTLAPTVAMVGALEAAAARIEELGRAITEQEERYESLTVDAERLEAIAQQAAVCAAHLREAEQAIGQAVEAKAAADAGVLSAATTLAGLEAQIAAAVAAAREVETLTAALAPLEDDLSDWALLVRACSPSGIPALLIDQALPEIGAHATELLRECFGEQVFSIMLSTQREAAAGDKLLETLDVLVSRDGEPLDASVLSGGESVLVSEALALALTLTATPAGAGGVLVRDEVGAALDISRGPAFVRMLRRAAELGGFAHVLVVSHQPACLELCDAVLEVGGGRVEVR